MTAAAATSATSLKNQQRPWWMLLIQGIAAVIIGAVMLWSPAKMTKVDIYELLVWFLGLYWVISGIMDLVLMFVDHSAWGWKLFMGIVSIMAGGWILMYPTAAALALPKIFVLVLGIWGLMYGIMLLIMAFSGGGWGAGILGVLGIVFGLILMGNYTAIGAGLSMLWAAAILALIGGFALIIQAFRQRRLE